jgi:hypothetical protein
MKNLVSTDNVPTHDSENLMSSGGIYNAFRNIDRYAAIDSSPTENSRRPVQSGGVYDAIQGIQDILTFDQSPTQNSRNPVTSGGIFTALQNKQDTLVFDSQPINGSSHVVTSDGIYDVLQNKQDTLMFDNSPTQNSVNLLTSGAIYDALAEKANADNVYTKDETDTAISSQVAKIYSYKGVVEEYSSLPESPEIGDAYGVFTEDVEHDISAGDLVAWNGESWDVLGNNIELTNYYTKSQVNSMIAAK